MNLPPLPAAPTYWPFDAGPFRLKLGVRPLDLDDWIQIDRAYPDEMALKRQLLGQRHREVFVAQPAAHAACQETLDALAAHLARRFPDYFSAANGQLHNRLTDETWRLTGAQPHDSLPHPLELAARLVQEDLCLMQPDEQGVYRLTAACVCFPSRWRLAEKFLGAATDIHRPVAHYDEHIGPAVDRLFDALAVDRPVWRFNWNLHESDALFQPTGMGVQDRDPTITADNAGDRLWLRIERQTLRRLPTAHALLFTIRTYLRPLSDLMAHRHAAAELAAALRQMPVETYRYKSLPVFADAALQWLDHMTHDL